MSGIKHLRLDNGGVRREGKEGFKVFQRGCGRSESARRLQDHARRQHAP